MFWSIYECTSVSMLEYMWNNMNWGEKVQGGTVKDQAYFCARVALTNKLELLKWVREEKKCEWNERTISAASYRGNFEMLKYCFANGCPYNDENWASSHAAARGHLNCLRFLFDKVKPSRETEKKVAQLAGDKGQLDILKHFFEERKISDDAKVKCVVESAANSRLDCLKYMVEEAKTPLDNVDLVCAARYKQHHECENYLLEKGAPEPTDRQYEAYVRRVTL